MINLERILQLNQEIMSEMTNEITDLRKQQKDHIITIHKLNNELEVTKRELEELKQKYSEIKGDYLKEEINGYFKNEI